MYTRPPADPVSKKIIKLAIRSVESELKTYTNRLAKYEQKGKEPTQAVLKGIARHQGQLDKLYEKMEEIDRK